MKGQSHRKMATQNHGSKADMAKTARLPIGLRERFWVAAPKGVLFFVFYLITQKRPEASDDAIKRSSALDRNIWDMLPKNPKMY